MFKKLLLGLILCVGSQTVNAADQDEPGRELALANREHQVVAFDPNTANAGQIANAAGTLALRAGTELVQQGVPIVRRGIKFSLQEIIGAGNGLAHRYRRDGIFSAAGAVAAGGATCLAFAAIAERFVPTWLALTAGTIVGARATRAAANNWNSMVGFTFNITVYKGEEVHYSSNNPNFERNVLEETLYGAGDNGTPYRITYRINHHLSANFIMETRTCTNLARLNVILDEIKEKLREAQQ